MIIDYQNAKQSFINLQKVKFDEKNQKHEDLLMSFWKVLKPNTPLTERLTNEWQNVGFQAKDPATDFRGAGFLGLQQLLSITDPSKNEDQSIKQRAHEMFRDSTNE